MERRRYESLLALRPRLVTNYQVVLTDYPDQALIDNLARNVEMNVPASMRANVDVLVGRVRGSESKV